MPDDDRDYYADVMHHLNSGLDGLVVDFVCQDCGRQTTTKAAWDERPACCGWEMVDIIGSVREREDDPPEGTRAPHATPRHTTSATGVDE